MNDKEKILSGMLLKDAVFRCGELQLSYEDTARLLSDRADPKQLLAELSTPGTDACNRYREGVAEGNLKLNINLEYNVADPKAKDAYKHLSAERRRQAINKKLEDLFGV